jgi:hypothetical protein
MERWRDECQRALARANPDGSDDHLVALILASYFRALHDPVSSIADPQGQDRLCQAEARRFLTMRRGVPARRQRMTHERATNARGPL